ncbi:hypothetical protein F4703DRAFT_1849980 [Phycomyces blakesleeanus]
MYRQKLFTSENDLRKPFVPTKRVDLCSFKSQEELYKLIEKQCTEDGLPLVIANVDCHPKWKADLLSLDHLKKFHGDSVLDLYSMRTRSIDNKRTMKEYIEALQWSAKNLDINSNQKPHKKDCIKSVRRQSSQRLQKTRQVPDPCLLEPLVDASIDPTQNSLSSVKTSTSSANNTTDNGNIETFTKITLEIDQIDSPDLPELSSTIISPVEKEKEVTVNTENPSNNSDIVQHTELQTPTYSISHSSMATPPADDIKDTKHELIDEETSNLSAAEIKRKTNTSLLYGKDISCPTEYKDVLETILPEYLLSLGSCDLFNCLPEDMQAENLMCYLGSSGTGTAIHRDLCGTFGHNLMTYGDDGAYSEWLIVEDRFRDQLTKVLHSPDSKRSKDNDDHSYNMTDQTSSFVESDQAWVNLKTLRNANIKTHVILQKPGDLVLIPSLCYHQVRNHGISMKVAWNRVTPQTLELALKFQLPIYQTIARPETYRCKSIIHLTLERWLDIIKPFSQKRGGSDVQDFFSIPLFERGIDVFVMECRIMLHLYSEMIRPEIIEPIPSEDIRESICKPTKDVKPHTLKCDFCHCDIFLRFYHCDNCLDKEGKCEGYDICLECYSQGRTCQHMDELVMQRTSLSLENCITLYNSFIKTINSILKDTSLTPLFYSNLEQKIFYRENNQYSLATTCLRIQNYRKKKGILANHFVCGHCSSVTTTSELYGSKGIELRGLFGREPCYKLEYKQNGENIYTCDECVKHCHGCRPVSVKPKKAQEMVYYIPPFYDPRNWGGVTDKGVYQYIDYFRNKKRRNRANSQMP